MKNVSWPEGSIFRKKGFFIALYSCLGAVAILAVVVTIANRTPTGVYEDEPTVYVGADQVDSYLDQMDEAWFRPRQTPPPEPVPTPPPREQPQPTEPPVTETEQEPEPEPPAPPPPPAVETFEPFTSEDRLAWPVYGEVVMPFSVTALIFDPTMDRFSTNDNLRISAAEGDPVRAGADGRVVSIGTDFWRGNYVTIDHGNGWQTTTGQLMESVLVQEGDIVRSGQIIGGIGRPSISAANNGTHVHLHVTYNGSPMNPSDLLLDMY
ncbi:MAG: M23 family metallopeptidase [Defluviitaleaceae bacterium]|nr:M23 family metallopeptidase [Defluviitaleaceae bacterium]MCL2262055.1 M23 family metallopeptidase [Defluviitaleaceae bacterium]